MSTDHTKLNAKTTIAGGWIAAALLLSQAASAEELVLEFYQAAPGLYLHLGKHEPMSVDNLGDIANIGFIVGSESIAVIDPGGSPQVGRAMRRAIREVTELPISHVILTHIHPDHIFGGSAFTDVAHVVAHRKYAGALAQRGEFYRNSFRAFFSDPNIPVSLQPSLPVADTLTIDLGARLLQIRAHKTAHTDNDLSVFDDATRTLWASDLIFAQRVPSLDGSLPGWIQVMEELAHLEPELVIPGHGQPDSWAVTAQPQLDYLGNILRETRQFIAQNKKLSLAVESIAATEGRHWQLFDDHHPGNITKAYTELEWE